MTNPCRAEAQHCCSAAVKAGSTLLPKPKMTGLSSSQQAEFANVFQPYPCKMHGGVSSFKLKHKAWHTPLHGTACPHCTLSLPKSYSVGANLRVAAPIGPRFRYKLMQDTAVEPESISEAYNALSGSYRIAFQGSDT